MALEQGHVHERLFHTITGLTKAEKRALAATSFTEPEGVTVDELQVSTSHCNSKACSAPYSTIPSWKHRTPLYHTPTTCICSALTVQRRSLVSQGMA